jgi:DNA-binding GntR family transcriptional regulator
MGFCKFINFYGLNTDMASIKKPLVSVAYDTIYRKIITLDYEPGQQLNEQGLTEDLSIGRTPIREALCNLNADMLIESQPGKGVIVRAITLQNTKSVFTALEILETGVAALAMRNKISKYTTLMEDANTAMKQAMEEMDIYALVDTNNRFHIAFSQCSQNVYLVEALRKVRCEANRLAYLSFANEIASEQSLRDHYKSVVAQHDTIIKHLIERDEEKLTTILLQHIAEFRKRIIGYLAS